MNEMMTSFYPFISSAFKVLCSYMFEVSTVNSTQLETQSVGIPGWRSSLAPAFGPGRDPGRPGIEPHTSGSRCMEPASPSAYVSASLSLSV